MVNFNVVCNLFVKLFERVLDWIFSFYVVDVLEVGVVLFDLLLLGFGTALPPGGLETLLRRCVEPVGHHGVQVTAPVHRCIRSGLIQLHLAL